MQPLAAWMGVSCSCGDGGAVMREGRIEMLGLATSELFLKQKGRGSSLCAWDKRNPRGLLKMSHPQRKHRVDRNNTDQ